MKQNLPKPFLGSRKWIKYAFSTPMLMLASIGYSDNAMPIDPSIKLEHPNTVAKNLFDVTVSGTVTDGDGLPIPGVTVLVSGTTIGTATDLDGRYTLEVPEGSTLTFSFIGYVTQDIPVAQQSTINVTLIEDTASLDEVVVIGYGTAKKSDLTGSVARINMEDRATHANVNLFQALVGASPGINLEGRGGAASEPTISIRGQTSLSASDGPLIVLDGVIYNGSISNININDVETIDVLKDASAAAVYGSRSANGVLLITTKKGKTEKPVISFGMYTGFQDMTNNPMRVMDADEFALRLVDFDHQSKVYNWYATNPTSPEAGLKGRTSPTGRR